MNNHVGNRNVIFITADQLRADCIVENGKYSKFVKIPNLDRLKKMGVSYELVTRNRLSPFNLIDIELVEGPLQNLKGEWLFTELGQLGCKVEMSLGFEMKKRFIDKAMGSLLENAAEDMVRLFSSRAASIFEEL